MKVMCIREYKHVRANGRKILGKFIEVGEIYHVLNNYIDPETGNKYYMLVEFGGHYAFNVKLFAVISDIDETELINERELLTSKQ